MGFGDDLKQGVEVRIQTERGGLSIKVWRNEYGDEQVAFRAIPHTDFGGRRVGLDSLLWQGTIDGEFHGQRSLFGPEPD